MKKFLCWIGKHTYTWSEPFDEEWITYPTLFSLENEGRRYLKTKQRGTCQICGRCVDREI